jgi:hypothetical protein
MFNRYNIVILMLLLVVIYAGYRYATDFHRKD